MVNAMLVDEFEVEIDLLVEDLLDHCVRQGLKPSKAARTQAAKVVRATLAGIHAQGLRIETGNGGADAVNLVRLARHLLDCNVIPASQDMATQFARARCYASVVLSSLSCQDRQVVVR